MRCEEWVFVGFVLGYQADHWVRGRQCKWQILRSSDLGCYCIWDRANFPHISLNSVTLWIYDENSFDNAGVFQLLLSSSCSQMRMFLLLNLLYQQGGQDCTRRWERKKTGLNHHRWRRAKIFQSQQPPQQICRNIEKLWKPGKMQEVDDTQDLDSHSPITVLEPPGNHLSWVSELKYHSQFLI